MKHKVDEHGKVVNIFVRLVLFQLSCTPQVYKERQDFPCEKRGWIHVQNANLGPIRMAWSELSKTVRFKTGSTLRGFFEVVKILKTKSPKHQKLFVPKKQELSCWQLFHPSSSWPLNCSCKKIDQLWCFRLFSNFAHPHLRHHLYGWAPHLQQFGFQYYFNFTSCILTRIIITRKAKLFVLPSRTNFISIIFLFKIILKKI
jgi:hypothetical protein